MSLSVVVNTKNMAQTLGTTLESVKELAPEIIIVDMKSSDGTVELAKKYTEKIFTYEQDLGFADPARNFALSKATGDWILVLDADEEVLPGLREFVQQVVAGKVAAAQQADAYFIPRQNLVFGKWIEHTGWWPDRQLRLFRKGHVEWTDKVHTHPVARGKVIELPADKKVAILHHNYQTIDQFVERLNRYTTIQAKSAGAKNIAPATVVQTFSAEFFRRLFEHNGMEDGVHGVSLSFLQAMYEVVVILKQWEAAGFPPADHEAETARALLAFQKDLNYWMASYYVRRKTGVGRLVWQIRRKFKM